MQHVPAIGMPSGFEWIIIAGLGLLFFGKRLPEVGKSLGKGIVEFKKGLKSIDDDVSQVDPRIDQTRPITDPLSLTGAKDQYKFDPFTGKPVQSTLPTGAKFDPYTGKPMEAGESTQS